MTLAGGARLGPYEIIDLIGRGGMGEVYRAVDGRLGRQVAIKVLPVHLADDAESLARFRREARAIAALSHPNIVAIFDIGNQGDTPFVVTELLDGETLRDRLKRGRLPLAETLRIGSAIAEGLAAAHAKGIIHRDLKPENVFLTATNGVKILDFGLASTQQQAAGAPVDSLTRTEALTSPGLIMGTIGYASPEQLRGRPLTTASDIFSFGCVVYEMLFGEMPFQRGSSMEVIASVLLDQTFTPETAKLLPDDMRELVEVCLAKDPSARLQNGGQLVEALRGIDVQGSGRIGSLPKRRIEQPRRNRLPLVLVAAVIVAMAIAGGLSIWTSDRQLLDGGYDLHRGDVTGDSETRRLTGLALRADAEGNRSEAIELLREAARLQPHAPLPAAFLASFNYYNSNPKEGLRWSAEAKRRVAFASSTYETLLCRYLMPEVSGAPAAALASSILELRPKAWRLRLSLAHRHLDQREMSAMLAQLMQIDVSAPDDRRLAIVLADRASLGDIAGATRDLQRSHLAGRPAALAYAKARIAWSSGHAAESARLFDTAAESARNGNLGSVAIDAGVLAGIARIGAGALDEAASSLDLAAVKAHEAGLHDSEAEAFVFGAYVAKRRGDLDGMRRRIQSAVPLVNIDSSAFYELRLFMLREGLHFPIASAEAEPDADEVHHGVLTLIRARRAWLHGNAADAAALLQQARSEGIEATWFAEDAALLAYDLGGPTRSFRPDPPYPNRLRFIAIWELTQPRHAMPSAGQSDSQH